MADAQPKSQNTVVRLTAQNGAVESIVLDATLSVARDFQATITDFPVEGKSQPSDHVVMRPENFKLEAMVTDYPLPHSDATRDIARFTQQTPGGLVDGFPKPGRAQAILERFILAQKNAELVDVVAPNYQITGYLIQALSHTLTKEHGKTALRFTCTLKQFTRAESQRVRLAVPKINKAKPKENLGKQNGTTPPAPEQNESLLYRWTS